MTKDDKARLASIGRDRADDAGFLVRLLDAAIAERAALEEKLRIAHVVRDEALARRDDVLKQLEHSATHIALAALGDENRALAAQVQALTAAGNALAKEWGHQAGRVFESMGSDNPRALAIDEKVDALEAAVRASAGHCSKCNLPGGGTPEGHAGFACSDHEHTDKCAPPSAAPEKEGG